MELDAVQRQLAAAGSFRDRDRFEVRGLLGRGGMGSVYRVYDHELQAEVALKLLSAMDGAAIMRFKREFRTLARFSHRNLVSLYELLVADDTWLFTMELVPGAGLDRCLRPGSHDDAQGRPRQAATPVGDFSRLRRIMGQLADGVAALHEGGYLHCDIKPSNILVTDDERVVLVDFGLITAIDPTQRVDDEIFGTPAYLSPERASGAELTSASDWFSVGAVLYRLLSGQLVRPQWTARSEALRESLLGPLPPLVAPSAFAPSVPDDLDALCMALLSESPEDRPSGQEILERLDVTRRGSRPMSQPYSPALIGRASHLDALRDALHAVDGGVAQVVHVRGAPGVGKSTLVHHFLDEIATDPRTVILRSRCNLRESLPHKALDGLIDALCNHLMALPADRARALLPDDMSALTRVFPLLDRVVRRDEPGPAESCAADEPASDLQGLQLRAARALRRLLDRIAKERPLILFIDDLHWGDIDSAPFLDALLRPPDTPPLLFVVAYREGDRDRTTLLETVFSDTHWDSAIAPSRTPIRTIDVAALGPSDSAALAAASLRAAGGRPDSANAIARESDGTPLFIHELAQLAVHHPEVARKSPTLKELIQIRLRELVPAERRLIELLAVAGQALAIPILGIAAGLEPGERAMLQRLRTTSWLRVSRAVDRVAHPGGRAERVELYHDRIREVVAATLDDEVRRDHYLRLARATADSSAPEAETLATYYQEAGDREAAARYALLAADDAASALSFAHASALYDRALALGQHTPGEQRTVLVTVGEMRQASGDPRGAVKAFTAAAELSEGLEAIDLYRRAAGEQMRNGDTAAGSSAMVPVFAEVGLTMPRSRWRIVARILYWRLRLSLRGLRFRARDPEIIAIRPRLRARACLDVATGMFQSAQMVASAFSVRALFHSLEIGDRDTLVAAINSEIGLEGALGRVEYTARLRGLLDGLVDPDRVEDQVFSLWSEMQFQLFSGKFDAAYQRGIELRALLRQSLARRDQYSLIWLREIIGQYTILALFILNDTAEMARVTPEYLADLSAGGNRPAQVNLRLFSLPFLYLNAGEPDRARAAIDEALELWGPSDFMVPHFTALVNHVIIDLYRDDGLGALRRCEQAEPELRRSLLLYTQIVRVQWRFFHSQAAVSAARCGHPRRARLLRQAARDARRLHREGSPWITALAMLLDSSIALARDDRDQAKTRLDEARRAFEACDMPVWASNSRWLLGHLVGGDRGRQMVEQSESALAPLQVADRPRMLRLMLPTFDAASEPIDDPSMTRR